MKQSGLILHPTSLPSSYGIGDLGSHAKGFVDLLADTGQSLWQMLPLQAPGHLGSPYSAESAFALNPMLIDPDALFEQGLVTRGDLGDLALWAKENQAPERVDFHTLPGQKFALLQKAYQGWVSKGRPGQEALESFKQGARFWLEDYVMYAALKEKHEGRGWRGWSKGLAAKNDQRLTHWKKELSEQIERHTFYQWQVHQQLQELKLFAQKRGVELIGDIPIFVAMDSADVWSHRGLFKLDESGHTDVVAGVPPDYFSKRGQKWGNPVYDWEQVAKENWTWWVERVADAARTFDLIRIDHFRGFEAYWETPQATPDAMDGEWVKGPGDAFFEAIQGALGELPFIAEDLGAITPEVLALRDRYKLPGMKVMHFGFGQEPDHPFLPHTYPEHCVGYTGTHDNDTTRGWFDALSESQKHDVRVYLSSSNEEVVWKMVEALFASEAAWTIIPTQDVLGVGSEARMNTPATVEGNWSWRLREEDLEDEGWERLAEVPRGV